MLFYSDYREQASVVVLGCVHTYVRRIPSSARNLAGGIRAEATGQPRTAAADVGAP
jgi:hypothetical protein